MTDVSVVNSVKTSSLQDVEEIQPLIEVVPSVLLNDIFSSIFPTISPSNHKSIIIHSEQQTDGQRTIMEKNSNRTEFVFLSPSPSTFTSTRIESDLTAEQQTGEVRSLSDSIDELCLLIRQLLHYELTEQKITPLQATIASRLALLLTYLVGSDQQTIISNSKRKNTTEQMTSIDEDNDLIEKPLLSTIGTQTDQERHVLSTDVHRTSSFDERQQEITELISTSGKE